MGPAEWVWPLDRRWRSRPISSMAMTALERPAKGRERRVEHSVVLVESKVTQLAIAPHVHSGDGDDGVNGASRRPVPHSAS